MQQVKLKAYRTFNKIRQEDMAKVLDIGLNTYNCKENGKTNFTLDEAKIIADFFNTTIEDIFFSYEVNFKNTV